MSKIIYSYDTKNLEYYPVRKTSAGKIISLFLIFAICAVIGFLFFYLTNDAFQNLIVKELNNEKQVNISKFNKIIQDLDEKNLAVKELQRKDDKIYRSILNVDPLNQSVREAGFGGSSPYPILDIFENGELMKTVKKEVDILNSKLNVQKQSYEKLYELALEKELEINCTPSIQPISIDDFKRISDYFGYRRDPFIGIRKMHHGVDFSAPQGCPVYATADGIATKAEKVQGYGLLVEIDHGFNYTTRYGHLDKIHVKEGQKIHRGLMVGNLGNTGRSTAPHLHYEVRINGIPTNPLHFFCNNISASEYKRMIKVLNEKSVERFTKTHGSEN